MVSRYLFLIFRCSVLPAGDLGLPEKSQIFAPGNFEGKY
jgi:hypothetical protein